jgi:hypothetical protein
MWKLLKSHKALNRKRLHVTLNLGNSCLIYFNSEIRTSCMNTRKAKKQKTNGSDICHCKSVICCCGKTASQNTTRADFFSRRLLRYIIWWMKFPSFTESQDSLWCVLESTTVSYSTSLEFRPHGAPLTTKISSNIIIIILFRYMKFFSSSTFSWMFYTFIIFIRHPHKTWSFHLLWPRIEQLKYRGNAPENWWLYIGASAKHG